MVIGLWEEKPIARLSDMVVLHHEQIATAQIAHHLDAVVLPHHTPIPMLLQTFAVRGPVVDHTDVALAALLSEVETAAAVTEDDLDHLLVYTRLEEMHTTDHLREHVDIRDLQSMGQGVQDHPCL